MSLFTVGQEEKNNGNTFYAELRIVADGSHRDAFKSDHELVQYLALSIKLVIKSLPERDLLTR